MSLVGVAKAADAMGVSPGRVRQMLASGDLNGERVGRAWAIEMQEVHRALRRRPQAGRPWQPKNAWALLALAEGRDIAASASDRHRLKQRLRYGLEGQIGRLSSRARECRFCAHPSLLKHILEVPGIVASGVSASASVPMDVIAIGEAEAYVRASALAGLVERFALVADDHPLNLILRVVDDDCWPFEPGQRVASPVVVAVDLLSAADQRSQRAGRELLGRL